MSHGRTLTMKPVRIRAMLLQEGPAQESNLDLAKTAYSTLKQHEPAVMVSLEWVALQATMIKFLHRPLAVSWRQVDTGPRKPLLHIRPP